MEALEQYGSDASEPLARNLQVTGEALIMTREESRSTAELIGSPQCEEACHSCLVQRPGECLLRQLSTRALLFQVVDFRSYEDVDLPHSDMVGWQGRRHPAALGPQGRDGIQMLGREGSLEGMFEDG